MDKKPATLMAVRCGSLPTREKSSVSQRYTGAEIGSYPIDIGREPGSGPPTLQQQFFAPHRQARWRFGRPNLKGLRVHINELYHLSFDEADLAADVVTVDISNYLVPGLNVIQFNPVGRLGRATVNVVVR